MSRWLGGESEEDMSVYSGRLGTFSSNTPSEAIWKHLDVLLTCSKVAVTHSLEQLRLREKQLVLQ